MIYTINQFNQNDYQYNIYKEQLEAIKRNYLIYGNNPELVIKYYNIDVDKSTNINKKDNLFETNIITENNDSDQIQITGTGIMDKFKYCTWNIWEFMPVMEMNPLTYVGSTDLYEGTTGQITILSLYFTPNPGDIFSFYYQVQGVTDKYELFQITEVNYQRTTKHILPIYQLTFRSAPISISTLKEFNINEVNYFDTNQNDFYSAEAFESYTFFKKPKENYLLINNLFNKTYSKYFIKYNNYILESYVFNNLIPRIKKINNILLKDVIDFSSNFSLDNWLHNIILIPETTKIPFIAKSKYELYEMFEFINASDKYPYELNKDEDGNIIWTEEDKINQEKPLAFLDKDFKSKDYFIILNTSEIYNYYYTLYKIILNLKLAIDNLLNIEIKEKQLELFNNNLKNGKKYYNFLATSSTTEKIYNTKTGEISQDIIYMSDKPNIIIQNDLNLPTAISFQGGVQL